jgi:hypothetical protein
LFLVTKDIDTLTASVLTLMGISAGTAVGSAIIEAGTIDRKGGLEVSRRTQRRWARA